MSKKIIFTNGLIDLAQPRLGSKVVFKTDDFFASANRIIDPSPAVFKEGLFDKNGKWMDGWESRIKRIPGHDYLIIKLDFCGFSCSVGFSYRFVAIFFSFFVRIFCAWFFYIGSVHSS